MCCRSLIPLRRLLNDIYSIFKIPSKSSNAEIYNNIGNSTILEDNAAAIVLAHDGDKYRPRTKHLSIKWHHFRDQISQGWLKVKKIDTKVNWADIFTKPLPRPQFEFLRDAMMGWKSKEELQEYMVKSDLKTLPILPKDAVANLANIQKRKKRRRCKQRKQKRK